MTVFPDGFDGSTPGDELRVFTVGLFPFDGVTLLAERLYADPASSFPCSRPLVDRFSGR